MLSSEKTKSLPLSPRKIGWLLAGIIAVTLFALHEWQCSSLSDEKEATSTTPPDSLQVYMLRENDLHLLAELESLRQTSAPDSFGDWVRDHYVSLQSIGLRSLEQATLWRVRQNLQLADAKLAKARELGQVLAENAKDVFLLQQAEYLVSLNDREFRQRSLASVAFATAFETFNAGKYNLAQDEFGIAYQLANRAQDNKLGIETMSMLQYLLARNDRHYEVIELGEQIIEKAQRIGYQRRLAIALYQVAEAYRDLDLDKEALLNIENAINIALSMHDQYVLANCYLIQEQIFYRMESYHAADETLQKLAAIDRETTYTGFIKFEGGQIAIELGEYGKAQILYEDALAFFQRKNDVMNQLAALTELSFLHQQIGDYETALNLEKESMKLVKSEGGAERLAFSLSRLGVIYDKMDSLDNALQSFSKALKLGQPGGKRYSTDNLLRLGDVQIKKGDLKAANEAFMTAFDLAKSINYKLGKAAAFMGLGRIALKESKLKSAHGYFSSLVENARTMRSPSLSATALFRLSQVEKQIGNLDGAAAFIENAIAATETLRTAILRDTLRVSYFATIKEMFDEAILTSVARGKSDLAFHYAERATARVMLDALGKATVEEFDSDRLPMFSSQVPPLDTLLQNMPTDIQIIEYRITPGMLLIWLVAKDKLVFRKIQISSKSLEQKVAQFLFSIGAQDLKAFQTRVRQDIAAVYHENRLLGRHLYELLVAPVAVEIDFDKALYIIADGVLHQLPFGALVTNDDIFFDERYIWARAPSLTILCETAKSPRKITPPPNSRFLMAAGAFTSTKAQIGVVKRLFENATVLEKEMASYDNLKKLLEAGQEILYLSVHSVSDAQHSLNSYVELYDNHAGEGLSGWKKIYARQLLHLDFSRIWLAVLNACETSKGKIVHGEGIVNMVRIFTMAQVPAVVASLWKNDDRRSAEIVDTFFYGLCNGLEVAEALQQAKKNTIRKLTNSEIFPLPYFWATLEVYINSPSKIKNKTNHGVVSILR